MKHSRFQDTGYWFEGHPIPHDQIQALCVAKGGTKVMYKTPGSLTHIFQWKAQNSKMCQVTNPFLIRWQKIFSFFYFKAFLKSKWNRLLIHISVPNEHNPSAGLTRTSGGNCEKSTCNGGLTWSDGTGFTWMGWMNTELGTVKRQYGTDCFIATPTITGDQWCGHKDWHSAVCEKSCIIPWQTLTIVTDNTMGNNAHITCRFNLPSTSTIKKTIL